MTPTDTGLFLTDLLTLPYTGLFLTDLLTLLYTGLFLTIIAHAPYKTQKKLRSQYFMGVVEGSPS